MVAPAVGGIDLFKIAGRSISGWISHLKTVPSCGQQNTTKTVEAQVQTSTSPKCTFSGVVAIDLKRFADSGVALVECPHCSRTSSLSEHKGILRFPSHDKSKTNAPVTGMRWAACETIWEVVGGEQNG